MPGHTITKKELDRRKELTQAALDLNTAVVEIEMKYNLSIKEALELLHRQTEDFLKAL